MNAAISIHQVIPASREVVFDHLTSAGSIPMWFGGPKLTIAQCHIDAKTGGLYRLGVEIDGELRWLSGKFKSADRPDRLMYSFQWDGELDSSSVIILLTSKPDGSTQIQLIHTGFATSTARDAQQFIWQDSLDALTVLSST